MITFWLGTIGVFGFVLLTLLRLDIKTLDLEQSSKALPLKDIGISIVIPARNEEQNLKTLLKSIEQQVTKPYEVIVVDDGSEDETVKIANQFGARVVEALEPTRDIKPKVNAMHRGFMHTSGDVVVFLDADTRLEKNFVEKLTEIFSFRDADCVSIQPYHQCRSLIDLLSMFFHLVSLIGSGLFSVIRFRVGLFGPCIAITRKCYLKSEGFNHVDVRTSLIEDVALEKILNNEKYTMIRFMGTKLISYRMYSRLLDFYRGWKKNISLGARTAPLWILPMLVAYLGFLVSAPVSLVIGVGGYTLPILALYIAALLLLLSITRYIGNYSFGVLIYPVCLMVFFLVFVSSLFSQILRRKVSWKGRKLKV